MSLLGNRFELLDRLGAGGMAEVFRARDRRLGREVAIKLLNARCSAEPGLIERFRQESTALAQLSHPNIVTLLDTGETDDGRFYLVMERLRGEALNELFRRMRRGVEPLPWRRLVGMVRQACLALHAAHARQIVHRDIKPSNLFRLEDSPDDEDIVKILDFGIAKFVAGVGTDGDPSQPGLTDGMFVGTAHYAAPEAIEPTLLGPVDGRADVYGLGVILYQGLAGALPFEGQPNSMVLSRTANEEPPPLRGRAPKVPPKVEAVVMRALARRPQDRYPGVRELAEALLAVVDEPVPARIAERVATASTRQTIHIAGAMPQPDVRNSSKPDSPTSERIAERRVAWSPQGLTSFIAGAADRARTPAKVVGVQRSQAVTDDETTAQVPQVAAQAVVDEVIAPNRTMKVLPATMSESGAQAAVSERVAIARPVRSCVESSLSKSESVAPGPLPSGPLPAQLSIAGTIEEMLAPTHPASTRGPSLGMLALGLVLVLIIIGAWWAMPGPTVERPIPPVNVEVPVAGPPPSAQVDPEVQVQEIAPTQKAGRADRPATEPAQTPKTKVAPETPEKIDPAALRRAEASVQRALAGFQEVVNTCAEGHVLAGSGTYTIAVRIEVLPERRDMVVTEVRRNRAAHKALPAPAKNCVLEHLRRLRIEPPSVRVQLRREFSPE